MKRIVIIGGGASGIIAAIRLAQLCPHASITIVEKNERIGKKLLTTGNGKCNITNRAVTAGDYGSPFADTCLQHYDYEKTAAFFESLGLPLKSDSAGRCYPLSESAGNCLNIFLAALSQNGIIIKTDFEVKHIKKAGNTFIISGSERLEADAVLLAFGSAAGVKGYNGYDLLHNLGLTIAKPMPALCPIPSDAPYLKALKGVRAKASLTLRNHTQAGEVQFNENAVSGICAFSLAEYVKDGDTLFINFNSENLPEETLYRLLESKAKIAEQNAELLDFLMVRKLGFVLLKQAGLKPSESPNGIGKETIEKLICLITAFPVPVKQPTDFKSAQTVKGGLSSAQIYPNSLESVNITGLYCCGEVLDANGPCGGYNLQFAWSSGLFAAESIARYLEKAID